MTLQAYCEPIDIDPARGVTVETIRDPADSVQFGKFMHFHDAAEFIWFRNVSGKVILVNGTFELSGGMAVFVPSMQYHDFWYEPVDKAWTLLHIDPFLVEKLVNQNGLQALSTPICMTMTGAQAERLDALCAWLSEPQSQGATLHVRSNLTELVLSLIAAAKPDRPKSTSTPPDNLARLRPALNLVTSDPKATFTVAEAATKCNLSTAYFSRRFKQVMGLNFSDYVLIYRLRLAARMLLSTGRAIGDIAYNFGFSSPAHFAVAFKHRFGHSPRAYRQHAKTYWQA